MASSNVSDANNMSEQIESALNAAMAAVNSAPDAEALRAIAAELNGKKSSIAALKSQLGKIADVDSRKQAGQLINSAAEKIASALEDRLSSLLARDLALQVGSEPLDLTEFASSGRRGCEHIVSQAQARLEDVFIGLGFQIAEGPEVETDFYNFEALNMPKSHPARSEFDTIFLDSGDANSILLRTHTSPVQIRVMQEWKPPIYAIMPGRVFRRDTPDATHMPVFHQIEGLVVDRGITFAHLAGTIEAFTKAFFGSDFTSRLRPSYFPFTEPSAEFDIRRTNGNWIELGGCGMVHPNVLRAGGIDPDEFTGFAFGFGIDRMAKERHNVEDIREMYTNDLRFIRQFS